MSTESFITVESELYQIVITGNCYNGIGSFLAGFLKPSKAISQKL